MRGMEERDPAADAAYRRARLTELAAVVVMSLTAVCTAWTGYQSSMWSGVTSRSYSEAAAARTESVRAANEAGQAMAVDVGLVLSWVEAVADGDQTRADFLRERFPDRLEVAAADWLELRPLENPEAPGTPFAMESYVIEAALVAEEREQTAEEASARAREASANSSDYVVMTILFAIVLFFASLGSKLVHDRNRRILLALAVTGLVVAVVRVALLPITT